MSFNQQDIECVNNIRVLSADVVQKANSGHPGMPMGMAPIAHVLWDKVMNFSPTNPKWANRDRFVLSNGHGCALLYTMLHLCGYNLSMADLQKFRQLHSKTPGHPENFMTEGIEVTTGPLGQGIANAVGLAIGEAHTAATFNKPGFPIIDHFTYVFCGDGCLQEGVSGEASSLAGHLGLGKLIVLYDDNKITIDGETSLSFSENVLLRYQAYGWHTQTVLNGDDNLDGILSAIQFAQKVTDKPSIIAIKTVIGFGSAKQGKESVHGAPLGDKDLAAVKAKFGFNPEEKFFVTPAVAKTYGTKKADGAAKVQQWGDMVSSYCRAFPHEGAELVRRLKGELPNGWDKTLPRFSPEDKADATRNLSGKVLNAIAQAVPELCGGSADLTPSNKTALKGIKDFQKGSEAGRYIRFGVREHGMAAIGNGLAAYGGIVPFTATFLNFIQYCFPSVRLAALSGFRQLFVMTHDSIGLGEDGPTHQPVEAINHCRATPNVYLFRPADGNETSGSYLAAMNKHAPSVLCLSRQGLPHLARSSIENTLKGGYVVFESKNGSKPDLVYVATGSEVSLAIEAAKTMAGKNVRVVSMPCCELFDEQSSNYRASVITPGVPTIAIETAGVQGWEKYSHYCIGMRSFGASAPIKAVMKEFGFTTDQVVATTERFLASAKALGSSLSLSPFSILQTHLSAVSKL
mmetsp:Transcript_5285/g.8300  ORF Transcript_5285/g.8300 Transcript_5285/m.8300 type:complete len:687 (+) Transcript_5285:50-2110(+)